MASWTAKVKNSNIDSRWQIKAGFLEACLKVPLADGLTMVQYQYITSPNGIKHQYACVSDLGNSVPQ